MYTFGQYVKDKVQEGVELGKALGKAQGEARSKVRNGCFSSSSGKCGATRKRSGLPVNWMSLNSGTCPTSRT